MSLNSHEFFALRESSRIEVKRKEKKILYEIIGWLNRETGEILVVNLDESSQGTIHLHWDLRLGVVDENGQSFNDFNAYECLIRP